MKMCDLKKEEKRERKRKKEKAWKSIPKLTVDRKQTEQKCEITQINMN